VFGTLVVVFLIMIVLNIVLGLVLLALPQGWRSFISDLVSGTLIAPYLAAVVTLVYYRLSAAHGAQAAPAQPGAGGYGPYEGGGGFPG
jgi:hypothetical protein